MMTPEMSTGKDMARAISDSRQQLMKDRLPSLKVEAVENARNRLYDADISKMFTPRKQMPNATTAKYLEMISQISKDNSTKKHATDRIRFQSMPPVPKLKDSEIQELLQKYKKTEE